MENLNLTHQLVQPHERVDLFYQGKVGMIQSPAYFTLSVDALLLAHFIRLPKRDNFHYVDFCSGNGAIPLLLSTRTKAQLEGIEIQEGLVDMAKRSAAYNGLTDQLKFIQADLNEFKREKLYDIISCNPPYFLVEDTGVTHQLTSHAIARHELTLTMDQWVKKASQMLKQKGKLYIVHRPNRLDDLFSSLLAHRFSIHRLQFIQPKPGVEANGVLIEAIYGGGRHGVKVLPSIVVHEADNTYTPQMQAIYDGY